MLPVIEQLYQLPSFRKEVVSIDDDFFAGKNLEDSVLYQLKATFKSRESFDKPLNIKALANSIKKPEGGRMGENELIDVQEFINIFFDALESEVKGSKYQSLLENSFGGFLSYELISKGCSHSNYRSELFYTLGLTIRNFKNVNESLANFVEGEIIEEFLCDDCKEKKDYLKRTVIKNSSNHLIFTLKRVEFDLDTFTNTLNGEYFELPLTLNIQSYTQQHLSKNLGQKKDNDEESKEQYNSKPSSEFEYKLAGVIVYQGTMKYGKYYSVAQNREDGTWHKFDQKEISKFDPNDLPAETFGGKQSQNTCAYVAIYDRIAPEDQKDD